MKRQGLGTFLLGRAAGWLLFGLLIAGTASGCGAVVANSGINDAIVAITAARTVDADQYAPYEYYLAKFYLYKAEEEWGRSQYETASNYAEIAERNAGIAKIKSMEDPWSGSPADPSILPELYKDTGVWNKMLGLEK